MWWNKHKPNIDFSSIDIKSPETRQVESLSGIQVEVANQVEKIERAIRIEASRGRYTCSIRMSHELSLIIDCIKQIYTAKGMCIYVNNCDHPDGWTNSSLEIDWHNKTNNQTNK